MKFYNIILFDSLILYIFSIKCNEQNSASSQNDCKDLSHEGYRCCYCKGKDDDGDHSGCLSIQKTDYENLKEFINAWEEEDKDKGFKIEDFDCKSIYIELGVLILILLLL